ncbi:hypothetical protein [Mycolicibacterium sp. XJ1819]
MTQLLLFDQTLPVSECVYRQVAVVFTAVGGRDEGRRIYHTHPQPDWYCDYLRGRQRAAGKPADARVMERDVTVGEWVEVADERA